MNHAHRTPSPARLLLPGALLLALLVPLLQAMPAEASAGACADSKSVTVVVDFTDVGGEIVTRCAPSDPTTGREALEAAGFVPTNAASGLICAIDSAPDPCPVAFEGSFWSYWHSTGDGEWTSYMVGADSSDPAPGEIDGWRYNDGSTPPGIAPADAAAAVAPAPDETDEADETDASQADSDTAVDSEGSPVLLIALGLAAVALVITLLLVIRSRRRGAAGSQPAP